MTCQVTTAEPGRELAFCTLSKGSEIGQRRYRLEPAEGGSDVVESFEVQWRPLDVATSPTMEMSGRLAEAGGATFGVNAG